MVISAVNSCGLKKSPDALKKFSQLSQRKKREGTRSIFGEEKEKGREKGGLVTERWGGKIPKDNISPRGAKNMFGTNLTSERRGEKIYFHLERGG